jgi:hypothetical protein
VLKVTLDMFSGRENPTMVAEGQQAQRLLDEIASDQTIAAFEQTAELQRIIHDLSSTESRPPLFDGLGYRGFVLRPQSKAANDVEEIRVYRGAIVVRGQKQRVDIFNDRDHLVERWRLSAARGHVPDSALKIVEDESCR